MKRTSRRRLAWTLVGLSVVLAAAVLVSYSLAIGLECPLCECAMAQGAFGVVVRADSPRRWDFDIHKGLWNPDYFFVPTFNRRSFGWVLTVPVWMPFVVCAILTAVAFRRSPTPPGHCRKCGYDLTGNVSGICPECGTPIKCKGETP